MVQLNRNDVFGGHGAHHLRKRLVREIDAAPLQLLNLLGNWVRRVELAGRGLVQAEHLQLRRNGACVVVITERDECRVHGALVKMRGQRRNCGFRGGGVVQRGRLTQPHDAINHGLRLGRVIAVFADAGALAHEEVQRGAVRGFQAARILQERHAAFGLRLQQQLRSELADHFLHQLLNAEREVHDLGAQHPE